jgi:hypothetical protein
MTSPPPKKLRKTRTNKPKLNFYSRPVPKPPNLSRQHTEYQVHDDGSLSYTQKRIALPKNAEPTLNKICPTSRQTPLDLVMEDLPLSIPEPFDDLPPEVSLDIYQPRRKRTAGVRTLLDTCSMYFM